MVDSYFTLLSLEFPSVLVDFVTFDISQRLQYFPFEVGACLLAFYIFKAYGVVSRWPLPLLRDVLFRSDR